MQQPVMKMVSSPVGPLCLFARGDQLIGLYSPEQGPPSEVPERDTPVLVETARQLGEYFAGERRAFDLPLAPEGTAFQQEVWHALTQIPFGETRTYGQQAALIQRPSASRAVGAANGRNPIGIIVPCHRVIGTNGTLTGYAGGLAMKQWLLEHERRHSSRLSAPEAGPALRLL